MQTFPKKRGILAVFLSDLQSEYNHTLLEGITKQANALHYDMVTFSFFSNTNRDTPFQIGEENILSLFHKGYADGGSFFFFVIVYAFRFDSFFIQFSILLMFVNPFVEFL